MASRTYIFAAVVALSAASCAFAQASPVKARDLYFQADSAAEPASAGAAVPTAPAAHTGHHLGLRYNLLQVNPTSRESKAVDPDANFSRGDCFALEFSPNRDGHLYIFNRGTSGDLRLLLPSAEMPDEASLVKSNRTLRVPQEYCFSLTDPPGVETLIVAVTERPEDLKQLREALQKPTGGSAAAAVQAWQQQQLAGRDLVFEKADAPESANEKPHTVYAVRTTTSGEPTRIVLEVKIRHE
jgi:hypothetical protein